MIRNLVSKLPSFTCANELRHRTFRSLSPIDKFNQKKKSEISIPLKPPTRSVTYTKEHFKNNDELEKVEESPPKLVRWREDTQKRKPKTVTEKKKKEVESSEAVEIKEESPQLPQVQYYEQYELEAARPRPIKSREVIDKIKLKPTQAMFGTQLQPNELQPYGSQNNTYSYNLIAPMGLKRLRKKVIKRENTEEGDTSPNTVTSKRSYSTQVNLNNLDENLEIDCINSNIKERSKEALRDFKTNFKPKVCQNESKISWNSSRPFDIFPPKFREINAHDTDFVKFSSQQAFRQRREQANKDGSVYYKKSYSDLVKLRKRDATPVESIIDSISNAQCIQCTLKKPTKILDAKPKTPISTPVSDKRNMSTSSKINSKAPKSAAKKRRTYILESLMTNQSQSTLLNAKETEVEQKASYSKSKNKTPFQLSKICNDPCREQKKKQKAMRLTKPLEPKDLDCIDPPKSNKVFLASKVRLPVVKCLPKFEYDCTPPEPCPPRADECLKVVPKRLPTMIPKECPCVEETFKDAPKLKRLCFEFKDPPKEPCFHEPCQTPRADDKNPYKFKPLRPLEMGECVCVEPPPMTDVKLKRLPPCQPHDVCWPVREPCLPEPCPPRADVCLKVVRKRLPILEPPVCICKEPPPLTAPPPLPRLCLKVPEPERVCPPPPVCVCTDRADKCYKPKRKVLPKFVPGDCPCEDTPMKDVNFKRLECVDEPRECIVRVPDHCQPFPRADYGCWEFEEETCYEVPEHCVEKKPDPCDPPPKCKDPCERRDVCKTSGPLNYNSKRKYNTDSTAINLFHKLKNGNNTSKIVEQKNLTVAVNTKQNDVDNSKAKVNKKSENEKSDMIVIPNFSSPTVQLLKELDKINSSQKMSSKKKKDNIRFNANIKNSTSKLDYDTILKKIDSSSSLINKCKPTRSAGSLSTPLYIHSRAISTSHPSAHHEKKIRDAKALECKKKCQKLKPKTLCYARGIKGGMLCGQTKCKDNADMCKKERVPVCCEKEEAPYAAFSDKVYDMKVHPYKDLSQCFKCLKTRWPCVPDYKPKCDKRKFFSTFSLIDDLPTDVQEPKNSAKTSLDIASLKSQSLIGNPQVRPKVFKIQPPEIKCDDLKSTPKAQKIMCINYDYEPCQTSKKSCKRIFYEKTEEKLRTPYPAFSDCLDEDMEDILAECPLEKDKYEQLQPRHVPPSNRIKAPMPPPPSSEPLDLLKEQHCIKAKLGKYEGTTQDCRSFGKKSKLLKARDVLKEPNKDCEKISQLKKQGRWPPFTLTQNRHTYSTISKNVSAREFSTFLGSLNSLQDTTKDVNNTSNAHNEVKRIYIRNFHSLIKNPDKSIFTEINNKMKELTIKQFPEVFESCKLLNLKNDHWRKENSKKFNKLNKHVNIPLRVKRFYTSYKIKHKYYLKKSVRNVSSKAVSLQRKGSDPRLKFYKTHNDKKHCKKSNKTCEEDTKCPKLHLDNCEPTASSECVKNTFLEKDCVKPHNPYPSFSECGDHEISKTYCECPVDGNQLDELQPRFHVMREIEKKNYPTEEKIDTTLGREYCRQKMGIQKELTLDCNSFPEYVSAKKNKRVYKQVLPKKSKFTKSKMEAQPTKPPEMDFDNDIYDIEVKCVKGEENKPYDPCRDLQACCSQILENSKLKKKKAREGKKQCKPIIPPCCLPEEDGACREYCKKIILSENLAPNEESYKEFCQNLVYSNNLKSRCNEEDNCKNSSEDVEQFCKQVVGVKSKDVPKKISGISEECAKKLLQDCEKIACLAEKCLKKYEQNKCDELKESNAKQKCPKFKVPCDIAAPKSKKDICDTNKHANEEIKCTPKCPKLEVPCEDVPVKTLEEECQPEPVKTLSMWQKIVNYFKARPGCPEPGDYKKKALNDKAHKAAAAAGLVAIDPKCLPPDVLVKAKSDPCCRACPSEQPICKPPDNKQEDFDICKETSSASCKKPEEDEACTKAKVTNSGGSSGKKWKFGMFKRNYSKSFSWTNLEEINKILEEDRKMKSIQRATQYLNKEFVFVTTDKEAHTRVIQKSLQYQLKPFPLTLSTVDKKTQSHSRTYFGYQNILPSRENMLERAWRLSLEASKRKRGEAHAMGLLNDVFRKVENSIMSQEDLEKMKTENVLKELDRFLTIKEDSSKDKKN